MTNPPDELLVEFDPRGSSGQYWAGGTGIGTLMLFAAPMLIAQGEMPLALGIVLLFIGLVVTAPILVVAWYFRSMRYVLGPDDLVLSYGPLMNDRIPLSTINSIRVKDQLKMSMLASFRFPGLAVFDVDYIDENRIRMCATSASKRILLIDTASKRYGITPSKEGAFLDALRERLDDPEIIKTVPAQDGRKPDELGEP